jgi:hypothetical protein
MRKTLSSNQIPLLKAYLRSTPGYPPHVPAWIPTMGWIVFAVLALAVFLIPQGGCFSLGAAAAISYLLVVFARKRYQPRNEVERGDESRFEAVRKLKALLDDGIHRRLPPAVLLALERAVEARNVAVARLSADHPDAAAEKIAAVDRTLHACFLAATPVIRTDTTSKGDWETMVANTSLNDAIVETIQRQTEMMRTSLVTDWERLAALSELDGEAPVLRALD